MTGRTALATSRIHFEKNKNNFRNKSKITPKPLSGTVKDDSCAQQREIKMPIYDRHRGNDIVESSSIYAKFRGL